jgi:hypothetical protein
VGLLVAWRWSPRRLCRRNPVSLRGSLLRHRRPRKPRVWAIGLSCQVLRSTVAAQSQVLDHDSRDEKASVQAQHPPAAPVHNGLLLRGRGPDKQALETKPRAVQRNIVPLRRPLSETRGARFPLLSSRRRRGHPGGCFMHLFAPTRVLVVQDDFEDTNDFKSGDESKKVGGYEC